MHKVNVILPLQTYLVKIMRYNKLDLNAQPGCSESQIEHVLQISEAI